MSLLSLAAKTANLKFMNDDASYWFEKAWIGGEWAKDVRVEVRSDGFITAVAVNQRQDNAELIEGLVLPGVPNLHSHAFQRAAAGLTEKRVFSKHGDDNFWTWRNVIHTFVTQLTPEDNKAIAAQLYVEMLKAGYTAVGEFHYLHCDPGGQTYADPCEMGNGIIEASELAGIGLTLLPVLYSVGGYEEPTPNVGQRRYILGIDEFLHLVSQYHAACAEHPQFCVGIAPHSLRQVPAHLLKEVLDKYRGFSQNGPIHIHIAEQKRDVDGHMKHMGDRPVSWLINNVEVDDCWCLIHATHMTKHEIKAIANTGAVVGLCPSTEANLGDGIFPFRQYLREEGRWGIGSDSHVSINPWEELRWLEYGQRLKTRTRNITSAGVGGSTGLMLLINALNGGAQALGRPIGEIAAGKRADFIVCELDHPQLYGRYGDIFCDSLIFNNYGNPIRHVMCGGRWVVRDWVHMNEIKIFSEFKKVVSRLVI